MSWYIYTAIIAYVSGSTVGFVFGWFFAKGNDND